VGHQNIELAQKIVMFQKHYIHIQHLLGVGHLDLLEVENFWELIPFSFSSDFLEENVKDKRK
jgi:hypothetical protein